VRSERDRDNRHSEKRDLPIVNAESFACVHKTVKEPDEIDGRNDRSRTELERKAWEFLAVRADREVETRNQCENFPHAGFVGFPFASFGPGWLKGSDHQGKQWAGNPYRPSGSPV